MSTISLDSFWSWLIEHPNCLVRVGSADAVLCDDEDFHWWLGADGPVLVVQVIRGKRLVAEMVVDPERVSYVEDRGEQEEGEHLFELVTEDANEHFAIYYFALTHGLEVEQEGVHKGAVH